MPRLLNPYFYQKHFQCFVDGFVVPIEFISGQSLVQLERTLGFASRRLDRGAAFAQLSSVPAMNELEYYGDTRNAEHKFEEKVSVRKRITLSNNAYHYLQAATKLIKVIALKDHNPLKSKDENWPPGLGAMQYKLKVTKPALVIEVVNDYPNGIFRAD